MASERQVAANRANSKQSTGPKTWKGRLTSCRNALRHGLSRPSLDNLAAAAAIEEEARRECGEVLLAVKELALAKLELSRIRRVRTEMVSALLEKGDRELLKRLKAIERYERRQLGVWTRSLRNP